MTHVNNASATPLDQQYGDVSMTRPHVVILGAGASRAALPDGDANGRRLPLMADFLSVIPSIEDLLREVGVEADGNDFELTYSRMATNGKHSAVRSSIETRIYDYFDSLRLPPAPTLYDYRLLGLRKKDVIATFNWDPLLLQAATRCRLPGAEFPRLLFLHGNVLFGFCAADSVGGYRGNRCSMCGQEFQPSSLLYPTAQKNYRLDPQIISEWDYLKKSLEHAFMVTVFGYSAPASDTAAVDALKGAWDENALTEMDQVEIIDIRDETELRASWRNLIHFDHYEVHASFYESWIAKHPRRTGEAHRKQYWDAEFLIDNHVPPDLDLDGLKDWHRRLIEIEAEQDDQ